MTTAIKRIATLVIGGAFMLITALCISGCTGESGAQTTPSVPGGYTIAPAAVDSSLIEQPESCAIVVAAAQGQAFKIPTNALTYAKAAIQQGNYAAYITADSNATPHGKIFATTKNSEAGKQKEIESFEADYFASACAARSEGGGIDLLSSLNNAANDLRANAGDGNSSLVMCVIASGINDTGLLRTTQDLLDADASSIASQLKNLNAIADFSNITVHFYGLGQTTGNQSIPASAQAKLQTLYTSVVEAAGGVACIESDVLSPLNCDDELPEVAVVDFEEDALSIPHLERGESAQVTLDETKLAFLGDSAEFANRDQATDTLSALAEAIVENGYAARIEGFTATSPEWNHDDLVELSQARADAVRDELVSLGVSPASIEKVAGQGDKDATSMLSGTFDEAAAKADRKVVVTLLSLQ